MAASTSSYAYIVLIIQEVIGDGGKYNKDFVLVTNFSIALKSILTMVNGYTRQF